MPLLCFRCHNFLLQTSTHTKKNMPCIHTIPHTIQSTYAVQDQNQFHNQTVHPYISKQCPIPSSKTSPWTYKSNQKFRTTNPKLTLHQFSEKEKRNTQINSTHTNS